MEELIKHVERLVGVELASAQAKHGQAYASPHEGYGVLAEEIMEAEWELNKVHHRTKDLLKAIRVEDPAQTEEHLRRVCEAATRGAGELIQVAAVARKMMES